jgi:hypothetical protein
MRAALLLTALVALAGCYEPTLAQTDWEGSTRNCGDPANDIQTVIYVVNPDLFARVATLLGYPRDEATGLPLEEQCDSLQAPVEETLDFTQVKECQTFTITYTVDMQDDALVASDAGGLVGGTISFLRDDGTTDLCEVASQRRFLDQ